MITGSHYITLRKVNVMLHGFYKMHMNRDLMKDKLYQIIDQFSERKIIPVMFYLILLNKKHRIYDGMCKILFANEDKIKKLIDRTKIKKLEYRINLYCIKCLMFTNNSNRWKK